MESADAQLSFQNLLQKRFLEMRTRNPSFSLRAYAKKIGLGPSAVSELLRGQRRVSKKLAERVAHKLLLDPTETHALLSKFENEKPSPNTLRSDDYLRLSADQFQLIGDWSHYAILSLLATSDFQPSIQWIARRLAISEVHAEASVERLTRLGLLKIEGASWSRTANRVHTSDDIFNLSLQKAHMEDMELAKNCLTQVPVELRDFTSISLPTSPEVLPKAKIAIRKFREEMAHLMNQVSPTEVYQMSVYLYPLTQVRNSKTGVQK